MRYGDVHLDVYLDALNCGDQSDVYRDYWNVMTAANHTDGKIRSSSIYLDRTCSNC